MKSKITTLLALCALASGVANAAVLQTNITANNVNNVGFVTTSGDLPRTLVTGLAFLYSSATDLSLLDVSEVKTRAAFETLIGANPGAVVGRQGMAITDGAIANNALSEIGAVGNTVYLWLQSTDGGLYGLFERTSKVPSLGTVSLTSATMSDLIGTSVFAGTAGTATASGFQLVPEPSVALLGALGAFGFLRRRRI